MKEVLSCVIALGAAVMMPLIFTVLGVCVGIRFSKALKFGLLVGVAFASALWCWGVYYLTVSFKWVGAIGAGLLAAGMCAVNFARIKGAK